MNKISTVKLSEDTKYRLSILGKMGDTFEVVINNVLQDHYDLEHINKTLKETTITTEGRFEGSKALAGKTILYKIKDEGTDNLPDSQE